MESLQGHLLIAGPGLLDPNFRRTIVLIGEHNDEGALGVVLNRPGPVTVAVFLPTWLAGPVATLGGGFPAVVNVWSTPTAVSKAE